MSSLRANRGDERTHLLDRRMQESMDETQDIIRQLEEERGGYGSTATRTTTVSNNGNRQQNSDDEEEDDNNNNNNDEEDEDEDDEVRTDVENGRDSVIERVTRRLRCLFSAITWPIAPLGALVSVTLLWVLYAAFVLEVKQACSHPLHGYAITSLILLVYAPHHSRIRSFLFQYSRERDGPVRPTRVRLYDQLFHTLCILYVYGGVTILQSCKRDMASSHTQNDAAADDNNNPFSSATATATIANLSTDIDNDDVTIAMHSHQNTCEITCPQLYNALNLYVTMLELFTLSLVLPLLFLPCIYLWILRRASNEAEAFWQESLVDGELFTSSRRASGPRVSAQELMNSLETVSLIRQKRQAEGEQDVIIWKSTKTNAQVEPSGDGNECCICMTEFPIIDSVDYAEMGSQIPSRQSDNDENDDNSNDNDESGNVVVRTKCGHCFHQKCLAGWIGGRWDPSPNETRRARRTCCPLCREDLRP